MTVCSCWDHVYDDCAAASSARCGVALDAMTKRVMEAEDRVTRMEAHRDAALAECERLRQAVLAQEFPCKGRGNGD